MNAIQAADSVGTVNVRIMDNGDSVMVAVEDSGRGIDSQTIEKIIDVEVHLKSKDEDVVNVNIPLDKFVSDTAQQHMKLNEKLFNQELENGLELIIYYRLTYCI